MSFTCTEVSPIESSSERSPKNPPDFGFCFTVNSKQQKISIHYFYK